MSLPFDLKRQYTVPLKIYFDGEVYYEFDEQLNLPINHQFRNQLNIDDPITLSIIAQFNATMYNEVRDTQADLRMNLDIPLQNIKREPEYTEQWFRNYK